MKLGEAVYKSQQKPEAGKAEGAKDAKPDDKDNVVDADFEDVKEKIKKKKKIKKKRLRNKGDVLWLKEIVMMS